MAKFWQIQKILSLTNTMHVITYNIVTWDLNINERLEIAQKAMEHGSRYQS